MKYSQRDELVRGLDELTDYIQRRGIELPTMDVKIDTWSFPKEKEKVQQYARVLGNFTKHYFGDTLSMRKSFAGGIRIDINVPRGTICTRVQDGTKIEKVPVTYAEVEVQVYSWNCEPILTEGE